MRRCGAAWTILVMFLVSGDATGESVDALPSLAPGELRVEGSAGPVVPIHPGRPFTVGWSLEGSGHGTVSLHLASFDPGPAGLSLCHQPSFEELPGPVGQASIDPPLSFAAGDRRWLFVCAADPSGRPLARTRSLVIEGDPSAEPQATD